MTKFADSIAYAPGEVMIEPAQSSLLLMRDELARGRYWKRVSESNFAHGLPERGAYAAEMAMKHYRRHIELMTGNEVMRAKGA